MIARRAARAVLRQQQHSVASGIQQYAARVANVASTSYKEQITSKHSHSFSSLSGAISPTSTRLAKKSSKNSRGTAVVEESFEEEDEELDDDEDVFAGISSESEVNPTSTTPPPSTKLTEEQQIPFAEQLESLKSKLDQVTYIKDAHLTLRKGSWRRMAESASNLEELRKCMDVATYWNELSYLKLSKLPKLSIREGATFVRACARLSYPELAYYALVNRADTGLEYDVDILRTLQANLVMKLLDVSPSSTSTFKERMMESQALEGALKPVKEWQAEEGVEDAELLRAQLSLVDRTLAVAALTPATTPRLVTVDVVTLVIAIRGIIRRFDLDKKNAKNDAFLESQVQPRIKAAINVLIKEVKRLKKIQNLQRVNPMTLLNACKSMMQYILRNGLTFEGSGSKRDQGIKALFDLLKEAPQGVQKQFQSHADEMLKLSGQTM